MFVPKNQLKEEEGAMPFIQVQLDCNTPREMFTCMMECINKTFKIALAVTLGDTIRTSIKKGTLR